MGEDEQIRGIMYAVAETLIFDTADYGPEELTRKTWVCHITYRLNTAARLLEELWFPDPDLHDYDDDDDDEGMGCYPGKWGGGEAESPPV